MFRTGFPNLVHVQDISYPILAKAFLRRPVSEIPATRSQINSQVPRPFSPTILKNMDDQSILAIEVILKACQNDNLDLANFQDWGLATCPRNPGRRRLFTTFKKFEKEGAWIVSPHSVTYDALHSPAGMLSQAFGITGPSIGSGGLAGLEGQAILAATSLFTLGNVQAVWAVFTFPEQEPPVHQDGAHFPESIFAFAIALGKPIDGYFSKNQLLTIRHNKVDEKQSTRITSAILERLCTDPLCPWWIYLSDGTHCRLSNEPKDRVS